MKKQISNKTYEEKVAFMDNLASAINKYRSDFYEKLSVDIYNEKGAIVGYQITLKKTNDVIIVYFLNYLIKLSSDAKKEFAEEYKNYNDEENKKS
ncbi:MAG: hypothetical protein LBF15_00605 [Candidatus Peribacteria bacterium]|nr:hypothetical protein [Candidatus Peribacteria bacterium]